MRPTQTLLSVAGPSTHYQSRVVLPSSRHRINKNQASKFVPQESAHAHAATAGPEVQIRAETEMYALNAAATHISSNQDNHGGSTWRCGTNQQPSR